MSRLEFFFDPTCPFTWATSRWLADAAERRDVEIEWRNLSLSVLNKDREVTEEYRAPMRAGALLHRVIAAAHADDANSTIGEFYLEWGRRTFHDGASPTEKLAREVVAASPAGAYIDAIDDDSWDSVVETSTNEALSLAGPDVGSPILAFGEPRVGIFGPIVSPPPLGDAAAALYDLVIATATTPGFFELKRGRTGAIEFGPRP